MLSSSPLGSRRPLQTRILQSGARQRCNRLSRILTLTLTQPGAPVSCRACRSLWYTASQGHQSLNQHNTAISGVMFLSCAVVALSRGLRQACKTTRHQHTSGLMAQASSGQIPVPRFRRCPHGAKRRQDTNLSLASAVCVWVSYPILGFLFNVLNGFMLRLKLSGLFCGYSHDAQHFKMPHSKFFFATGMS